MCISAAALSAFQRPFGRDSYAQIEQAYAGLPLMVAIWSLECPPCMKELEMLGELKLKYPGFNLVLINTDGLEAVVEAEALLSSFGLSSADAWIYASDQPEQLRFSIDPQWYGELPRSYVYHDGQRQGSSGLIDKMRLQEWLSSAVGG
jgi:thiol-disulfide isomerase/thioredoxin